MNKTEIIQKIKQLEGLSNDERAYLVELVNTKKKYGLVWEDKPEDVEEQLRTQLPVLKEVVEKRIMSEPGFIGLKDSADSKKSKPLQPSLFEEAENQGNQENQMNPGSDNVTLSEVEAPNHILIEGDNLHALTALTFTHEGAIDLIYIDPPYNTGNKDFIYNDNYVDKEDVYKHSKWLSFMYKRLLIAKKLLSVNGVIFISIDDNELPRLTMILEELFGFDSVKNVCVKMSEPTGVKMASVIKSGRIPKLKEYILIAKPSGINNLNLDKIPKKAWDEEYNKIIINTTKEEVNSVKEIRDDESRTKYSVEELDLILSKWKYKSLSEFTKENNMQNKDLSEFRFNNAWRIVQIVTLTGGARDIAKEKKKSIESSNTDFFSITTPQQKLYIIKSDFNLKTELPRCKLLFADDYLTVHPGDFWEDIKTTGLDNEGGVDFKNGKKPLKLIEKIISTNTKDKFTCLDFFAGSGTTFEAVIKTNSFLNKTLRCILVTDGGKENICEKITFERCKYAFSKYASNNNLRYYKTEFVPSHKTEPNKRLLTQTSTDLLCIKEDCYTELTESAGFEPLKCRIFTNDRGKYLMVVYHNRKQLQVCEQLIGYIQTIDNLSENIKLYAFSPEKETLLEDFAEVADTIDAVPLPEAIYNAYRATFRTLKLDTKPVETSHDDNVETLHATSLPTNNDFNETTQEEE